MTKVTNIPSRLHSVELGNIVAGANEVYDDTKGKKQNVINSETDAELLRLEQSKQDNLTFDNAPTENSNNPVKSGGVYAADLALQQAIEAILLLIPSAATAVNQLADKAFVNSSISTATATFRGTYNVVTDLHLEVDATHAQIETALTSVVATADNNDYCFVQTPVNSSSQDIQKTSRYKFNGSAWVFEYDLNTSGFTSAQWAAINSGITLALVGKLDALPTAVELATQLEAKQNVLTFDDAPTQGSNNPVKSGGIYTAIKGITDLLPAEASALNQLADKAYVLARILAATPAFKGQFTTLTDLEAVQGPKSGDLGIVRTTDSDGLATFTFYQYLNNAWNVFYTLAHHLQNKPATTGTTGNYPYNGMGRVVLPMNIKEIDGVTANYLEQSMMPTDTGGNTIYVITHDYVLASDITIPANCVIEFEGGNLKGNGLLVENGEIRLNNSTIELSSPIVLKNSNIFGNNGIIKASNNYAYPYLVKSTFKDKIDGITIDCNNIASIGLYIENANLNTDLNPYTANFSNIEVKNAVYESISASIIGISGNTVITNSSHGLVSGDHIMISGVNGGYPQKGGTVYSESGQSCFNDLFIVEVLTETSFTIYKDYIGDSTLSVINDYSQYVNGGDIIKIGAGIYIGRSENRVHTRTCIVSNTVTKNCCIGIVEATEHNKFSNITTFSSQVYSFWIRNASGSVQNNIQVDNTIKFITGIHGYLINGLTTSDFMLFDKIFVEIRPHNSSTPYAYGEVEDVTINNAVINVENTYSEDDGVVTQLPILYVNSGNLSLKNVSVCSRIEEADGGYRFIKTETSIDNKYENITFIKGYCYFYHEQSAQNSIVNVSFENIHYTQSVGGLMKLYAGRKGKISTSDTPYNCGITLRNVQMNIALQDDYGKNLVLENCEGEVDCTNIKDSLLINCPFIINNDLSFNNTILRGDRNIFNPEKFNFENIYVKEGWHIGSGNSVLQIPLLHYADNGTNIGMASIHLEMQYIGSGILDVILYFRYVKNSSVIQIYKHSFDRAKAGITDVPAFIFTLNNGYSDTSIDTEDTYIGITSSVHDITKNIVLKIGIPADTRTLVKSCVLCDYGPVEIIK